MEKLVTNTVQKSSKNFWIGKKVLITGHTGFKGSWLSLWLIKKGACVYGYSLYPTDKASLFKSLNLENYAKKQNFTYQSFEGDIRNKSLLRKKIKEIKPDIVFHLAAQPLVIDSYENPIYTWETNLIGTLNLLEALNNTEKKCAIVIVSTDKVYENKEWEYGYREIDKLGGHDPYSASKAGMEIAIQSWRKSFCGNMPYQNKYISIASARAGNVIGGGDWAKNRIIPDIIRGFANNEKIDIRNPNSTRPWQHVLDPLNGYILLAENLYSLKNNSEINFETAFNFGPSMQSNVKVKILIDLIKNQIPITFNILNTNQKKYESKLLFLSSEKARRYLGWEPKLKFSKALEMTISWYKSYLKDKNAIDCCINDLNIFDEI